MPDITINEVRRRLQLFAKEHATDSDEKQHAQQFWRDFYMCFGLSKSSASMFEARVLKVGGAAICSLILSTSVISLLHKK